MVGWEIGIIFFTRYMVKHAYDLLYRFPYNNQCTEIDAMFTDSSYYEYWAGLDNQFTQSDGTIGYYQCYCNQQGLLHTLFKGSDNLCWSYFMHFGGGRWTIRLMGIVVGILNNLSYFLTKGLCFFVGFREKERRDRFIFLVTFFICYLNAGMFATEVPSQLTYLSVRWYGLYAEMIISALIMTNFMPYIAVALELMIFKCCMKKKRSFRFFQLERKNGQILATIFVSFTYGYGMPMIFIYLMIPLVVLSLLDRYLQVYWFKPSNI